MSRCTSVTYEDHFSGHAEAYAKHRPRYPAEVYRWLAAVAPGHELAWDVGTGNGQVAVALADHFARVVATDASSGQLVRSIKRERVEYRNEPADRVSLPDRSVDLIAAGAAAHWFELEGFYREVNRVARREAVIALWSYGPRDIAAAVDPIVHHYQEVVLRDYWPERIGLVHDRYTTLPFPFEEIEVPPFTMTTEWTMREFLGFLDTWSASQRYLQERGTHPLDEIEPELARAWGDPAVARRITWPLFFRAGRVHPAS